jgi:hypothetical protein
MLHSPAVQQTALKFGILNSTLKIKVPWSFKTLKTLNPNNTEEQPQTLHKHNCQNLKPYKANSCSISQEIPHILQNLQVKQTAKLLT